MREARHELNGLWKGHREVLGLGELVTKLHYFGCDVFDDQLLHVLSPWLPTRRPLESLAAVDAEAADALSSRERQGRADRGKGGAGGSRERRVGE
eukprot:scaffold222953_cov32-Tisochrysis_lutea.AAC.5